MLVTQEVVKNYTVILIYMHSPEYAWIKEQYNALESACCLV